MYFLAYNSYKMHLKKEAKFTKLNKMNLNKDQNYINALMSYLIKIYQVVVSNKG